MSKRVSRTLAATAVALGIILGCNSGVVPVTDTGGLTVDGDFSDAPTSPGGTGGTSSGTIVEGSDDVELTAEATRSFFTAFQIDPEAEDTAGPKFVVSGDVNQDGLLDLVSAWNQSQPVQLHLQQRDPDNNISFRTVTLAGTSPLAVIAGVELGQINDDGWLDVVVLSKATGAVTLCPKSPPTAISALEGEIVVLFSPGDAALIPDGDRWTEMILVNPYVRDRWIHNQFPGIESQDFETIKRQPEYSGFTALAVGDIDGNPGDEIVVAINPGECKELGQEPPINTVDLWINPQDTAEDSETWGVTPDLGFTRNVPISVIEDAPEISDVLIFDVDGDGDNDIVAAVTNSISLNLRWVRNPLMEQGAAAVIAGASDGGASVCEGGANEGAECPNGNADCVGIADGICLAGTCAGGATNGGSCTSSGDCAGSADGSCVSTAWHFLPDNWQERPVGQLDTNANVMAFGDIDGDTFSDLLVRSTPGQIVQWFRRPSELVIEPEFPPSDPVPDRTNFPWPVFTLTEFSGQEPEAIALGDLTGDGVNEAVVAVEGGIFWYDSTVGATVFDPWFPTTIIQDTGDAAQDATQASGTSDSSSVPGSGVGADAFDTSTHINSLLIVDLDGDGRNDIIGTLDRRSGAGLSDDRLVWYRNTRD